MTVMIKCLKCAETTLIQDEYNNERNFTLEIVGEQIIEVKCKNCGGTWTIVDGEI